MKISRKYLAAAVLFAPIDGRTSAHRPHLEGVFIDTETRTLVATDGCAMLVARNAMEIEDYGTKPVPVILPIARVLMALKTSSKRAAWIEWNPQTECLGDVPCKPIDMVYPPYARAIPQTVTGEAASIQVCYLNACEKARKELGYGKASAGMLPIWFNGGNASVVMLDDNARAILYPLRNTKTCDVLLKPESYSAN